MDKWSDHACGFEMEVDELDEEIVVQHDVNDNSAISSEIRSLIKQFAELKMHFDWAASENALYANLLHADNPKAVLLMGIRKLKQRVRELSFNVIGSSMANQCEKVLEVKMFLASGQVGLQLDQKATIRIQIDGIDLDILQQFSDFYNLQHGDVKKRAAKRVTFNKFTDVSDEFKSANADNVRSMKLKELQFKEAAKEKALWCELKKTYQPQFDGQNQ
ncbi:uncharacterized protein LOC132796620 [Drosophila nasuta]|uniref:uncharacterized protein LOC132796620 n=1 Tax=Drosophila nasuta TaxID=42062 RepID=UPI00295F2BCD|nr:uncharacterized protein LOC132796620 [Drosophila nasuta]